MRNIIVLLIALLCFTSVSIYAKQTSLPIYTEQNTNITVLSAHPQFQIKLISNATTGYSWFLQDYNSSLLQAVRHIYQAPQNRKIMGAPGYEVWTFKVKPAGFIVPQQTTLRFIYMRPWEKDNAATPLVFTVTMLQGKP
ncbi:MAG: hypothetical protein ACD_45C00565G0002 [uncultured bacterium]|nr:MAG: hypothetical protein ACD_45C00565G0002 [uncultured bacterium]OGT45681.1 MAG: hypothetical protein A3E83_02895 [Gammaproteobacteria bacterium RIFCSPHIGHO2_12_FULL_41_20]